jgi:hypothetical protein
VRQTAIGLGLFPAASIQVGCAIKVDMAWAVASG